MQKLMARIMAGPQLMPLKVWKPMVSTAPKLAMAATDRSM